MTPFEIFEIGKQASKAMDDGDFELADALMVIHKKQVARLRMTVHNTPLDESVKDYLTTLKIFRDNWRDGASADLLEFLNGSIQRTEACIEKHKGTK